jgi:hypothetical protein
MPTLVLYSATYGEIKYVFCLANHHCIVKQHNNKFVICQVHVVQQTIVSCSKILLIINGGRHFIGGLKFTISYWLLDMSITMGADIS